MSPCMIQDQMWTVAQIGGKSPTEVERYSTASILYSFAKVTPESEWLRRDVHAEWPRVGPLVVAAYDDDPD